MHAVRGHELLAGLLGPFSHAARELRRNVFPGGKTVGNDLSVRLGVTICVNAFVLHSSIVGQNGLRFKR